MSDTFTRLQSLTIAVPCSIDWDSMPGDERTRFCSRCKQRVHHLSAMSESEAEALLQLNQAGTRVCVRFYRRPDGTVVTTDCRTFAERLQRRAVSISVVLATGLLFGLYALGA